MSDPLTGEKVSQLQQEDIRFLLLSDDLFDDVTVITEDEGNVVAAMDKALGYLTPKGDNNRKGVCAIVKQPVGSDEMAGVLFGPLKLDWEILVVEHRETNKDTTKGGTGKKAWTVARRIQRILKAHRAGGLTQTFVSGKPCVVPQPVSREINGVEIPLVGYAVRFSAQEGDQTSYTKVANPTISGSPTLTNEGGGTPTGSTPNTVTLACSTEGAAIYYTTDMSHPCSQNTAATLYTAPVTISEACTLRVRAHKTGSVGSDTVAAKFT